MEAISWIGIGVGSGFVGYSLYKNFKFKHKNGELTKLTYSITEAFYPEESLKGLILKYINQNRNSLNLPPVKPDTQISSLAAQRCLEVDLDDFLSHSGVVDEFQLMYDWGLESSGEILAFGYNSALGVVSAWMDSESHYKTLMGENYNVCGIAVRKDENNRYIYCVLFGATI